MLPENATPAPDKFSGRTDAENRDYVFRQLTGQPAPRQPRAFTNTEASKASCRPGAVITRSHRHHAESEA